MNKSSFLTFVCSLIPGAGQMYLGYLQRGVWHMSLFCLMIALTSIIGLFGLALPVLWAYAFFDTFSLRSQLKQGIIPDDCNPFGLDETGSVGSFLAKRHALLGWLFILAGGYTLLDRLVLRSLRELLETLHLYGILNLLSSLPTLIIAALLVLLGFWLIRGRRLPEPDESDYQPYSPPAAPAPEARMPSPELTLDSVRPQAEPAQAAAAEPAEPAPAEPAPAEPEAAPDPESQPPEQADDQAVEDHD